jgi:hypothetical protein
MIIDENASLKRFPIGLYKDSLGIASINLTTNNGFLFTANELEQLRDIAINVSLTGKKIPNFNVDVLDGEGDLNILDGKVDNYLTSGYVEYFENIIIPENRTSTEHLIVMYNVDKIKNEVNDIKKFSEYLSQLNKDDKYRIIIIDPAFKLKKFMFEPWFTDTLVTSNGLWVGSGLLDQSALRLSEASKKYKARISNDYAWLVKNNMADIVKLVSIGDESNEE